MVLSPTRSAEGLGQSEAYLAFQEQLSQVAPVDRPVLLVGERGTGKELGAHRLHYLSQRWEGPFVTLNCSTLSPGLIESELFGHERGAFTGADNLRVGRFEAAHGGTLFLDEIGTIPLPAQEKILRVVEYASFERVGSSRPIEVDVRIVCATNADLRQMAERGEFKRDLLDRLSFEVLFLPPLRYRHEDIMLLARHFGARMAYELEIETEIRFSERARKSLESHPWRGNVRELKNVVERAVYKAEAGRIDTIEFDPFVSPYEHRSPAEKVLPPQVTGEQPGRALDKGGLKEAVASLEVAMVQQALAAHRFNQKKAARALGLSYDQLRGLLRKYRNRLDSAQ
jgi:psp operon transcriptional activator